MKNNETNQLLTFPLDIAKDDPLTDQMAAYLEYCRHSKRLAAASMKAYCIDMAQFLKFIRNEYPEISDAANINRSLLQHYISIMNDSYRVKSVKRKIACLKGFLSYLESEGQIDNNPFLKLHLRMRMPVTLPTVMSLREVKKILAAVYSETHPASELLHLRDIAVLEMFFATGLRVHELCNLKYNDLNLRQSSIRVIGKGNKERYIYITNKEVLEALNRYCKVLKKMKFYSDYIFLNKNGIPLSTQAARNIVTKYTRLAGIKRNITPHAFRHTFATLLLEEGVDIKYIQEFLGHSSISTTQIYLHVSASSCRHIINKKHPREKLSFCNTLTF
ncbi:tyrosine-type recombinase/integrase [Bacilliculturomica massiliensis]|uniref:tyrosine-type recombinase/integrase n=1 Tax=Bacilliculturomica massiliensis TaxID=1917867 RepID=UPI00102F9476|nr:tyrosine-type recombinase/integrase [Bacilliculturomica massiliensis]